MMRLALTFLAGALALGACGQQGGSLTERAANAALGVQQTGSGETQARFQRLLQARQGHALDVQLEQAGVRGGFLREARRGSKETWLGTDGVTLTLDRGVLAGTAGFGSPLLAADVRESAAAILAGRTTQVERIHSLLEGDDRIRQRAFICDIRPEGREKIKLDTGTVSARKMTETCHYLDGRFTNEYWVDPRRGMIIRSRQWAGPEVGMLGMQAVFNY